MKRFRCIWLAWWLLGLALTGSAAAVEVSPSVFDTEQFKIRYSLGLASDGAEDFGFGADEVVLEDGGLKRKSEAKAFLLSLAVPGLGQWYNGSRIKPLAFLGTEVAAWLLYAKWHNKGNDLTREFEALHDEHWSKERYTDYLRWVYDVEDDEDVPPSATEVTHRLPDTKTQQYYEMTGKYDQFAWGWDDAEYQGRPLESFAPPADPPPAITGPSTTPYSATRIEVYEPMRREADDNYRKATRMIFVAVANRLVSAFESFIAAKKHNRRVEDSQSSLLSRIKVKPALKSYHSKRDTPFLTLSYRF